MLTVEVNITQMNFVREPVVLEWIDGNTVPSEGNLEGVTTKLVNNQREFG